MSDEDFADAPMTIGEIKATIKSADATKWSPRDALVNMLRHIDRGGEPPDAVVIISWSKAHIADGISVVHATDSLVQLLGMIEGAKVKMFASQRR